MAGPWLRAGLAAAGLLASVALAPAAAADAPDATPSRPAAVVVSAAAAASPKAQAMAVLRGWTSTEFSLPDDLALDADLREPLARLGAEQRERVARLVEGWIDAWLADAASRPDGQPSLANMLTVRYQNEMTLLQLDSRGEAHDRLWLPVAADAGRCGPLEGRPWLAATALALQRQPVPVRQALVEVQAALLARWGQPRDGLAPLPATDLAGQGWAALQTLRGLQRPGTEPPATPQLAWIFLRRDEAPMKFRHRCGLVAWALRPMYLSQLAHLACLAQDRDTTRQALQQAGPKPDLVGWARSGTGRQQNYETCARWAMTELPAPPAPSTPS